jgi:hypothetical protein
MFAIRRHLLRDIGIRVLLVPFFLSALLAPGVMPHRASDGTITLVLCSGEGPLAVRVDLVTGEAVPVEDEVEEPRCTWNIARDSLAPLIARQNLPMVRVVAARVVLPEPVASHAAFRFQRPLAHAPPVLI